MCIRDSACAAGEKEHIGFHPLRVKDAGGQPQDGVKVAFFHQVAADLLAVAVGKENVIGQHNGSPRFSVAFEAAVDML